MAFLSLICFPGTANVHTRHGLKSMTELEIGEDVKVMQHDNTVGWSPVIGWLHNDPKQDASFIELWTATKRVITMSADHLLPVVRNGDGEHRHSLRHHEVEGAQYVTAGKVAVGDSVLVLTNSGNGERLQCEPVTAHRTVQSCGIYSPLTNAGTVLVDHAAASCYASVPSHSAAHTAMAPIRAAYGLRGADAMAKHHTEKDGKVFTGAHSYVDKLGRARFHHKVADHKVAAASA